MTNSKPIHLFDIASNITGSPKSWSPNTFKTRLVLNFKNISYTQSWVSYADITPLLKSLDVTPNKSGTSYTLPAIVHHSVTSNPNGAMMDSLAIAMHLDTLYPSPPLFPSGDCSYALFLAVDRILGGLAPALRQLMPGRVPEYLDPRGKEHFIRGRSGFFESQPTGIKSGDEDISDDLWALIESQMNTIILMLRGRHGKSGPFFEGAEPSYADFVLVSAFASFYGVYRELWERIMSLGQGELRAQWDACLPWIQGQGEEIEWPMPQ